MWVSFCLIVLLCSITGCSSNEQQPKTVLKVVPAGSLLQPFDEVEKTFEAQHPDVDVQVEGTGVSRQSGRLLISTGGSML